MERDRILTLARRAAPLAVQARRHLHERPELSFQEQETAAYVADRLRTLGYQPVEGLGGHGVKAVLPGGRATESGAPTVALRADLDALPIQEETGLPFASGRPGVMHACGHDIHTAVLLGAAAALLEIQAELACNVVFIFQPAEETNPGGASLMINAGALSDPEVSAIFGMHILPAMDAGQMAFGAGPQLAAPDEFEIVVRGRGGHGAAPHHTVDPVVAAAQVVVALQSVVARNVSPFIPAVVTVGSIHGGTKHNIIPDEVRLHGTIRTMDPAWRKTVPARVEEVAKGVCAAFGAGCGFRYEPGYPVLVNDPAMTEFGRRAAAELLGAENVGEMQPSMGGEDFAFYLEKVPGTFARLGAGRPGEQDRPGLHTARLNPDEACIPVGIGYYLAVATAFSRRN